MFLTSRRCPILCLTLGITWAFANASLAQVTGFGSAVSFDGVNDELRSDANFDTQSITIEAWVQVRSFGPAGFGGLAAWGRNSDAAWEVALGIDGRVTFACNWNKSNYRISSIPDRDEL